ncbi:hypothetical protein, partial [Bacteroides thetaiotaomicron]|uniref:hypothetical protein n=1 Tax=Bacteroides thetaiotaomicron TaxID=818 RepID=UPI001CE277CD
IGPALSDFFFLKIMFFYPMFIRYFLGNSQTKDKRNRELFSTKTSEEDWYSGNKAEVKVFFINWNKKKT